jgi:energy-coupling factor transport system ATP-binding protein
MIEVNEVSYSYGDDQHAALQGVSLCIKPGEMVGIVGPNGSGKSTLGRLIKGLMSPTRGTVLVDGLNTRDHGLEVRRRVGLVFQNPNSQIVNSIVEQEVAFGPENVGLPTPEIHRIVKEVLDLVGMTGREHEECHGLTMADKQRVALASVLALEPRYLILDEPTAWIQPRARWPLLHQIVSLGAAREVGLILITHRMDEALLCDRLYGMLDGTIAASSAPAVLLQDERVRNRLALDVPETYQLAHELQDAGLPVGVADRLPVGGDIDRLADALCRS